MTKIMKTQFIKLRKDKISLLTFFGLLFISMCLVYMFTSGINSDKMRTGGEEVLPMITMFQLLSQFFLYVVTAQICGADFMDKTCNYEILSGHTRKNVFFGRAITAIIVGTVGTMFLTAAPAVVQVMILGWGDKVSFGEVLLRYLLMAFPLARIVCEYIFLTFIIKNPYIVMGISYLLCMLLGMNIPMEPANHYILGMTNITMLTSIDMWASFGLGGDIYYIYETSLSPYEIIMTIAVSVAVCAAALFLGYMFFKNDDMN